MSDPQIKVHIATEKDHLCDVAVCEAYGCHYPTTWRVSWWPGQFHDTQLLPVGGHFCDKHYKLILESEILVSPVMVEPIT